MASFDGAKFFSQSFEYHVDKPETQVIEYSEESIQEEREKMSDEIHAVYQEIYDMAREAMNFQFGEFVHHGIQAGSHAIDAWEHYREMHRMELENQSEQENQQE